MFSQLLPLCFVDHIVTVSLAEDSTGWIRAPNELITTFPLYLDYSPKVGLEVSYLHAFGPNSIETEPSNAPQ